MAKPAQNSLVKQPTATIFSLSRSLSELPTELVLNVFRSGAATSRSFCLTLCAVSSWTRRLALPYLLNTVMLVDAVGNDLFHRALQLEPPLDPLPPALPPTPELVRNIWVEQWSGLTVRMWEACQNVTNIVLTTDAYHSLLRASSSFDAEILSRRPKLDVTMLCVARYWTKRDISIFLKTRHPVGLPIYDRIVRLRFTGYVSYERLAIDRYTRLSHLAVPFSRPGEQTTSNLLNFLKHPSLEMLVVVLYVDMLSLQDQVTMEEWVRELRRTDSRIYIVNGHTSQDRLALEWERQMNGGDSIWEMAIRHVQERGL